MTILQFLTQKLLLRTPKLLLDRNKVFDLLINLTGNVLFTIIIVDV